MTVAGNKTDKMRVDFLKSLTILDTAPDKNLDRIVSSCRLIFDIPIAAISLVDDDRAWFKSMQGLEITESARKDSFCNQTISQDEMFEVLDTTLDEKFQSNPAVVGPAHIHYYAGTAITIAGFNVGSLCLMDIKPRAALTKTQIQIFKHLADVAAREIYMQHLLREAIPLVMSAAGGTTSVATGTGTVVSENSGTTTSTGVGTTTTTGTGTTTTTGTGTTTSTGVGTTTTTGTGMTTTTGTGTTTRTGEGSTESETEGLEVTTTDNE